MGVPPLGRVSESSVPFSIDTRVETVGWSGGAERNDTHPRYACDTVRNRRYRSKLGVPWHHYLSFEFC